MPQGLTVPAWYNDDHYISEKVDECNTIKFGDQSDWNVDSVKAALASAFGEETYAPWMGYDNFVSNGNAENCSPSRYFVVSEYLAAKAAQLNEIQYEDKTDWDQAKVLDAFRAANISAWDHYTTTGQQEGINPSNAFDNDAFFTAKCAILNAWQNEDGTVGYEGKDDWTKDDVIAVFQSLGINPIMNQPENPDAASLVISVPTDEQVSGGSFNPWAPPDQRNTMTLRWKQASWNIPARMEMTTLLVKSRIASVHLPWCLIPSLTATAAMICLPSKCPETSQAFLQRMPLRI